MPMSNEVITHKHEWEKGLFSELDRIVKDKGDVLCLAEIVVDYI